jgi:GT2 family glycosyltransferase
MGLLSVCVVTRNASELLKRLLTSINNSLGDHPKVEFIIVDNDSSDDTGAMLEEYFPGSKHLFFQPGIGFSKGINRALSQAKGEFVLIATPSTEVLGDAIPQMVSYFAEFEDVGIVGPKVIYPDGTTQHSSKKMPHPKVAMLHTLYMFGLIRLNKILEEYFLYGYESDEPLEVESLTMSLLICRRAVFEQVGLLDENLFAWASDVDWCNRVTETNWRQMFIPATKVVHRRSSVSKKQPITNLIHYHRDLQYFYNKHYQKSNGAIVNLLWRFMLNLRLLVQIFRFTFRRDGNFSFY